MRTSCAFREASISRFPWLRADINSFITNIFFSYKTLSIIDYSGDSSLIVDASVDCSSDYSFSFKSAKLDPSLSGAAYRNYSNLKLSCISSTSRSEREWYYMFYTSLSNNSPFESRRIYFMVIFLYFNNSCLTMEKKYPHDTGSRVWL